MSGAVSNATAIPIIMGMNVGTCVTALISCTGTSKNAKRAAFVHLHYNIIKTVAFMVIFYTLNIFMKFAFMDEPATALGVAIIHTAFNVVAVIIMTPMSAVLEKLAYLTIPKTEDEEESDDVNKDLQILDPLFLNTPALALEHCKNAANEMANYAKESMMYAMDLFEAYDEKNAQHVVELESIVDKYEDQLGTYLVKLSSQQLTEKDSQELSSILHCMGDFERISDHAVNVMESAKEMHDKELSFSKKAEEELEVFTRAMKDIINTTIKVYVEHDLELAKLVEPMEENIDYLNIEIKKRHVKRLRKGKCTIEMGFVLSDITTNYERVSDHCSNIAISLLQLNEEGLGSHELQDSISSKENISYAAEVQRLRSYYELP